MTRRKLSPWLVRSSVLAIGVSIITLGASAGLSQSFNSGDPTVNAGALYGNVSTSNGVTDVVLNTAQAVLTWTPDESGTGDIVFQAAGTTANFSRYGGGDFAVLNRVVASDLSRAIRLDGNIRGWVGSSAQTQGGTVFFYSPSGIIIGSTARIDVGNLGLTTSDPDYSSGNFIDKFSGYETVSYKLAERADSAIVIEPTSVAGEAQINAITNGANSYVTLFAPVIRQNGIINVNGSAALVAASEGTITWSDNGLFDVQVTTGTAGDANGVAIEHGGDTGGTVSGTTDGSNYHRVYLVAVPKNTAITTLIKGGSALGFDVANAAEVYADGVVLTGGYDLSSGDTYDTGAADATGAANIIISNATFRSSLSAYATGNVTLNAEAGGTTLLWGSLLLDGKMSSNIVASGAGSFLDARSDVAVNSTAFDRSILARGFGSLAMQSGSALLSVDNGAQISIGGNASVAASASGADSMGGTATVSVTNGGVLTVDGNLSVDASANRETYYGDAGSGTGGLAHLTISGAGSSATVQGDLEIVANGYGTEAYYDNSVPGGDGYGGTALVEVGAGTGNALLTVGGSTSVAANGSGAYGYDTNGGNGFGNNATVNVLGAGKIDIAGSFSVSANGNGGDAEIMGATALVAGSGQGGTVSVDVGGTGELKVRGSASLNADGVGGGNGYGQSGSVSGGNGLGGTATLGTSSAGATLDIRPASYGDVTISASAYGGNPSGYNSANIPTGGNATGGTASVTGNGGTIFLTDPTITAYAEAGSLGFSPYGTAGNATGGRASFILSNGAQATITTNGGRDNGVLSMIADAKGGNAETKLTGGSAAAGSVDLQALSGGRLTVEGDTVLSASSFGGAGGGSADGRRDLGTLPPSIWVRAEGGSITLNGPLTATADAVAGNLFAIVQGGQAGASAYAGSISIVSNTAASGPSTITAGDMTLSASALGGRAATNTDISGPGIGSAGGVGSGGRIVVAGQGGNGYLSAGAVSATATGKGGDGNDAQVVGGAGGTGNGGSILIGTTEGIASGATSGGASFGALTLNASATGGNGGLGDFGGNGITGAGGAAFGGSARIGAAGSTVGAGAITLNASAMGGNAGNSPNYNFNVGASGNATAGLMEVIISGRSGSTQAGSLQAGLVTGSAVAATGTGGTSGGLYYSAGPVFSVSNGNATLAGLSLIVDAAAPSPLVPTPAGRLLLNNGTVSVTGGFTMRTPGNMSVYANQSSLNAGTLSLIAGNFVADSLGTAPATPGVLSANSITIGSGTDIIIAASLNSQSLLSLAAPGTIFAYDLTSTSDISVAAGGAVNLRNLSAGGLIDIDTAFALSLGTARAAGNILLDAGGAVITAGMDAGDSVAVRSGSTIQVSGPVTAGIVNPTGTLHDIGIYGLGSVQTGNLQALGRVGLVSGAGSVTAGAIQSGSDVLLLSGGNVSATSIASTGGAGRYVYIANSSMLSGLPGTNFDPASIFAAAPVAVNGTITVGGGISGGAVLFGSTGAFASGDITSLGGITGRSGSMTTGALSSGGTVNFATTGSISTGAITQANIVQLTSSGGNLSVGGGTVSTLIALNANNGLLSITGNLSAPTISLRSNDIAIGSGLRIDAGDTGTISLYSTNAQGTRIGDGTSGSGYLLDKAEFSTLNSGSVSIGGVDGAGRVDMTIGDLEITGPLAGSTIDDPNGRVTFYTGNLVALPSGQFVQSYSGTIRVTGSVRARGFLNTNGIAFRADVFEMDAQTGLLEILGQGGALAGNLFFNTPRIYVAEASILDKLAQNPLYAGRATDINTPIANARPDGVVRVGNIELGNADAVLVQNTGTRFLSAGFLTTAQTTLDREGRPTPGSIDLIINGQLQTSGGVLTGEATRNFLIDDINRPYFTADSSINGCPVGGGVCASFVETPNQILQSDNLNPPQMPGLSQPEVQGGDDSELTPEERRQRELAEKEAKSLPIPPPVPLINTQPLNPTTDLDEPVSGSGNPSLIGDGTAPLTIGKGKP